MTMLSQITSKSFAKDFGRLSLTVEFFEVVLHRDDNRIRRTGEGKLANCVHKGRQLGFAGEGVLVRDGRLEVRLLVAIGNVHCGW